MWKEHHPVTAAVVHPSPVATWSHWCFLHTLTTTMQLLQRSLADLHIVPVERYRVVLGGVQPVKDSLHLLTFADHSQLLLNSSEVSVGSLVAVCICTGLFCWK